MVGDARLSAAVFVDDVEIEVARVFRVRLIGCKNNSLAVGMPEGREIGGAIVGDLVLVAAVGVHHPYLEVAGTNQPLGQQGLVIGDLFGRGGMLGAVNDLLSVERKEWSAVVAQFVRKLANVRAVRIHGVD